MTFVKGQRVRHPSKPEWGIGEVLDADESLVTVFFEHVGQKKLRLAYVELQPVEGEEARSTRLDIAPKIDLPRLKELCKQFHELMRDNRETFNDGGMALEVLADIEKRGSLRRSTKVRLSRWCHTDGAVFQPGVDLAQAISTAVFGYVIARE